MIAYRLHLEEANVNAVELARSGKLGKLRIFNSTFSMQVREGDM
jgi:glucose-fructose oxidoreductase